jgi:hypothetical protein
MQPSKSCNVSPRQQHETHLSEQRRKFLAKQRVEQELEMPLSTSSPKYDPVDRIHRHARRNLSGNMLVSAVRPRRESKHEHGTRKYQVPELSTSSRRTSSMMYRRGSMRTAPRLEANLEDELLNKGASSLGLNGGSDRLARQKRQTKSIVLTNTTATVVTPPSSPRPTRRRSINVVQRQPEREQTLISAFHSKLGMGW